MNLVYFSLSHTEGGLLEDIAENTKFDVIIVDLTYFLIVHLYLMHKLLGTQHNSALPFHDEVLFLLFIEFVGVTLVNKVTYISGTQLYNTSSVYHIVHL